MDGSLLQGKTALITGAASGIGAAAAAVFAAHGASVVLADTDVAGGTDVAAEVETRGGQAVFIRTDVRSDADVAAVVQCSLEHFGRLDCAFNNAGIDGQIAPLHESTEHNWDEVLGVNLTGVWRCLKYEIRQMLTQGSGAIVNTASVAGVVGVSLRLSAYVAAKHGVVGLTKEAALEYATQKIRINALCPGGVRTAMLDEAIRKGLVPEQDLLARQPVGRFATPEEIAEAAAWLCSDASSFVTGHAMAVDGGWTAQ
ncbi:glucose 1-dehydrogenase [Amycolatopsis sp. cmx-11-12]|uniref:glucose 1-dehydrogenase n=1 Tax=Amycolatopsis sp. cmx-11-12 TaxID=2785795 RepID=UPI0039181C49